jgi:hypothetical protein
MTHLPVTAILINRKKNKKTRTRIKSKRNKNLNLLMIIGGGQWAVYEAGRNSLPPAMNNRVKWEVDQLRKIHKLKKK